MTPPRDAVEVVTRFGDTVLDVTYVGANAHYDLGGPRIVGSSDGFVFHHHDGVTGELALDGCVTPLACAVELPILPRARIRARVGLLELSITRVAPPQRSIGHAFLGDRRAFRYLGVSLAVHVLLWGVAVETSPPVDHPVARRHAPRPVQVAHATAPAAQPEPQPFEIENTPDQGSLGSGAPMSLEEGAAGGESPAVAGHILVAEHAATPRLTRDQAIQRAREAGILGSAAVSRDRFAALVGTGDLSSGFDQADIHGPLYGGAGEANGGFGLGHQSGGPSAGCRDGNCGIIGRGTYGTLSNGLSPGRGWGGGRTGAGSIGGRGGRYTPSVELCTGPTPCVVTGALEPAVVRRYVRRRIDALAYCFEKDLLVHSEDKGEVVVDAVISPDGTVQGASGRVPGVAVPDPDDPVATCLADVVRRVEFPRGAGATQVTYSMRYVPSQR